MVHSKVRRSSARIAVALALLGASGCASHRGETRPGASPPFGQGRNATIGIDKNTFPRGRTMPPAGLGVDLI